ISLHQLPVVCPTDYRTLAAQPAALPPVPRRAYSGSAAEPPSSTPGTRRGDYRPTPPKLGQPVFTHWADVRPFALRSASQFRPAPPPALTSNAYKTAFDEVRRLGSATSTARSADQTQIGQFWAPPIWITWNEIAETAA